MFVFTYLVVYQSRVKITNNDDKLILHAWQLFIMVCKDCYDSSKRSQPAERINIMSTTRAVINNSPVTELHHEIAISQFENTDFMWTPKLCQWFEIF